MNRDQKAAAIEEIATQITEAHALFAVDPTGLSVSQSAEVRTALRNVDATLRVVKNSLTERAADQAGLAELKALLDGPTALTFVRGDAAAAAKAIADYSRTTDLLPFKGGFMDGAALEVDQIKAIARLPSREVLYGQLVGLVATPITGLARTLNALLSGVAIALDQVRAKAEAGEIQLGGGAGEPAVAEPDPAAGSPPPKSRRPRNAAEEPAAEEADAEPAAEEPGDQDAEAPEPPAAADAPAEGADDAAETTETDNQED